MKGYKWKNDLNHFMRKVEFNVADIWNPDAPNKRIPGQYGEHETDHTNPNENLCVCIDISEPNNYYEDYAEVIEYLLSLRNIRNKFKRINFNFWAVDYYLSDSIRIRSTLGMNNEIEEHSKKAEASIDTSAAIASSIFKPLDHGNNWRSLKPALILVLTKGKIINDMENSFKTSMMKYFNKTLWICIGDDGGDYSSTIIDIDSRASKRIILTNKD